MPQFIAVEVTTASYEEASAIASRLVEEQLAGCVQILGSVKSVYRWQGQIETSDEHQMLIKTRQSLFEQVAQLIKELHSYDEPQIIALPIVAGSAGYLQWLSQETLDSDE